MQIDVLQAAALVDAVDAWRLSRDKDAEYNVDEVAAVDAPVMEMPSMVLAFSHMTILEREIICSLRNHVVWARTSRVDNPLNFTVPEEFQVGTHLRFKTQMHDAKQCGQSQDEWRLLMPLVAHTAWVQRISLRDLARLAKYFGYLSDKAKWPPLAARFAALQYKMTEVIAETCGGKVAHTIMDHAPLIRYLFEGIIPSTQGGFVLKQGYFKFISVMVPIATRAQIIRHRELQFVDDLWALINTAENSLPFLQLDNCVFMQLSARSDVWQAILSRRACWIAQADLWQPIIKAFGMQPPLPCDDGKCPFELDARARLEEGKDPNPPCPRFCNLYKINKAPHKARMMAEAVKRDSKYWKHAVELETSEGRIDA
jgi:hypothetical protein